MGVTVHVLQAGLVHVRMSVLGPVAVGVGVFVLGVVVLVCGVGVRVGHVAVRVLVCVRRVVRVLFGHRCHLVV